MVCFLSVRETEMGVDRGRLTALEGNSKQKEVNMVFYHGYIETDVRVLLIKSCKPCKYKIVELVTYL